MRTNIDIDDKLMKQAMKATKTATKKAAVEACMRQVIQLKKQAKIRELFGKVAWRGHDDDWFASDEEIREKHRIAGHTIASEKPKTPALPPIEPASERGR
jgi:Arc/MetJ family transcription regulator